MAAGKGAHKNKQVVAAPMEVSLESGNADQADYLDDDGRTRRTGTIWTASSHIITAVIGSGVLSLAWAIAQLGWVAGPTAMLLFAFVTYYTATLLAECYRTGDPETGKRNYTYMDAVRSNLGGVKVTFCGVIQYANLVGVAIGYTIASSISMQAIGKAGCFHTKGHANPCKSSSNPYMIIFGATQILFSQIPDFDQIWKSCPNLANPASSMSLLSSSQKGSHSGASYGTNPSLDKSSLEFALSSLVAASDEQMECIPDEELTLLTRKFRKFYNKRKERRGGGSRTCFECGDPVHFIADRPKKKRKSGYHDNNTKDFKQEKNRFYKKGKNSKKFAKAITRTCVATLSDMDLTSSEGLTSSEEEVGKPRVKRKDDFTGLCFMAKNDHDTDSGSDSDTSEVPPTLDELSSELDHLRDVLLMQDDRLRSAVRENREFKSKWESAEYEITSLRSKLAKDDIAIEYESCQFVMNDLAQRESVDAQVAS
ncbi:hypothetical protein PR202_ga03853 [Eleusine coracana subsp. coracana]|uniref:Amino acid transporter transmembrane domain-containing protein n=1 Tax=Eleusine coracana subsp. coracana TaxID=191504 RepID=A0AAV5BPK5_ELECO|nr:hypothetical protein PR202_ga03853 [Eleusine coracana subsp. coracana]